jgi:NTP pyrophosphatase (non-canonical NTP hydrolase)
MSKLHEEQDIVRRLSFWQLRKLRENRYKRHWRKDSTDALLLHLRSEIIELHASIRRKDAPITVALECADVANFAAMIADVYDRTMYRRKGWKRNV